MLKDILFEGLFYKDLVMIAIMTVGVVKLRAVELQILIHKGIYKDLTDMSD